MKTKISAAVIALFFLAACGSSDTPKQEEQTAATEPATPTKFVLKGSNMMYLAISPADSSVIANQPDPTKAVVFEKIDQGDGKCVIKVPSGLYLIENRNLNNQIFANSPNPWGWETFEIVALDNTKINIKGSSGMFVSTDKGNGMVSSITDNPSDAETFIMESK